MWHTAALAQFYDLFDHDAPDTQWHAAFLTERVVSGDCVLDMGAGTGRAALTLCDHGARVWCVEPAPAMRAMLLARIADDSTHDHALTILPGAAESVALGRRFDLVAACHLLYLLPDDALGRALDNLRAHLQPDGLLVGDFALRTGRIAHARSLARERRIGDVLYRKFTTSQHVAGDRWLMSWSYEVWHQDALLETHEAAFDVWVRNQAECRALLATHGLRVAAEYAGYNGAVWRDDASAARYVFEARI